MAEGIAGVPAYEEHGGDQSERSELLALREEGKQMVKVTKMFKKNIELFYPEDHAGSKFLDDFLVPPAPANTTVTWSRRYLREKVVQV